MTTALYVFWLGPSTICMLAVHIAWLLGSIATEDMPRCVAWSCVPVVSYLLVVAVVIILCGGFLVRGRS